MRLILLISALGIFGAALIGMGLFHGWWWAKPYPHRTGSEDERNSALASCHHGDSPGRGDDVGPRNHAAGRRQSSGPCNTRSDGADGFPRHTEGEMRMSSLICERCKKDCGAPPEGGHGKGLWTLRDPAISSWQRHHGYGILSVCADCLYELGGTDYRDMSAGQVLRKMATRRASRSTTNGK